MNNVKNPDTFHNYHNIIALLICALGVGLNLLCGYIVSLMGLPLYLDTIGTITVAALGGYLPGVIVGFTTNIIKSISDPSALYYGVLNVLIALSAAALADKGWFKKIPGILAIIINFTLIGGGLGAFIPWFMDGLSFDSESLSGILYGTGYFSVEASHLLSSILLDLPDKTITVILVLIIFRLIPERYRYYFRLRGWMQTPLSEQDYAPGQGTKVRLVSLRLKIILALCISLLTVFAVGIGISLGVYRKTIIKEHTELARGTARIAASIIDGDMIDQYLNTGGEAEGYEETREELKQILYSSPDITYLYVYKMLDEGCQVVFDIDTISMPGGKIGTVIPYDREYVSSIPKFLAGEEVDPVITKDEFGHLLTAYQPVYDSERNCVCYVGADVEMSQLTEMEQSFFVEMITVFLGFIVLLCVFVTWFAQYQIIYPIMSITNSIDKNIRYGDTQESLEKGARSFRNLDIHTGDEVEKLFKSINNMVLHQTDQMRSIRRLSESTAKMQDGLIITMADMVENRDSDTGAHIQKTAAYVKIIVEGLRKKGYYAEKITDKFISDVIRSAPLHDVGKIEIPDEVLNKPGKLTDDEYEIMKTHTTLGMKIIDNAISTFEGDNYLKEARNMAAYHHERWDGKGYPEKLHGEVIPLSARIMAVADVFDAITSPRVYKPAFPLDKSLMIIEEGIGTQFDPKCVEVFMEALPEVKVILRKYNQDSFKERSV